MLLIRVDIGQDRTVLELVNQKVEGKEVTVESFLGAEEALRVLKEAIDSYRRDEQALRLGR